MHYYNKVIQRHVEGRGRYLVASKDIVRGEIVLYEQPFAHTINYRDALARQLCHRCLRQLCTSSQASQLDGCNTCQTTYYCSIECRELDTPMHSIECQQYQRLASTSMFDNDCKSMLKLCLRVLVMRHLAPTSESFDNVLQLCDNRHQFSASRMADLGKVARFLEKGLNMGTAATKTEVLRGLTQMDLVRLMCVLECNTHEIGLTLEPYKYSSVGSALYIMASYFNHSCQPNVCRVNREGDGGALSMIALADIPAGTELSYNYIQLSLSNEERKTKLFDSYFFNCVCPGCAVVSSGSAGSTKSSKGRRSAKGGEPVQSKSQQAYLKRYLCDRDGCNGVRISNGPSSSCSMDQGKPTQVCNICLPVSQWPIGIVRWEDQ
ncbi:hypothetical protein SAMD00019534_066690, partial [Acytostelium subglobosum LB1]|uniref:hypothetical protein n=1 Tax=Acytostelium subglobosum LB1 TaxID=1410327 RepID=UPI00064492C2